jgi:hypothetical protein
MHSMTVGGYHRELRVSSPPTAKDWLQTVEVSDRTDALCAIANVSERQAAVLLLDDGTDADQGL